MPITGIVDRGSIVWFNHHPTRGHEQNGCRASIVISDGIIDPTLNQIALTIPVTTQITGHTGRLQIVLTLSREVPYILMDEPLSGLDPMVRESIVKGMISYIDLKSQSLIMTSHEVAEIETLIDSFIRLKTVPCLEWPMWRIA